MKTIIQPLLNEETFYELKEKDELYVFVFSANWCPDCVFIKPFMPELMEKYKDYNFIYVDRDQYLDICIQHEVLGIPSFIAYKNGEEKGRFVSKLRKTKQEIDEFLGGLQ